MPTAPSVVERIAAYYRETTESSYLGSWAKGSLGLHFGLADEHTESHAASIERTNEHLAKRAGVQAGDVVLDAGCGVGGSTIWLARHLRARAVGITLVPEQVSLARNFAEEHAVADTVEFHCMDMLDTTFTAGTFDVVWNIESVCHVVDLRTYARHVFDLLRQGGRWACIDLLRGPGLDQADERLICEGWALAPLRTLDELAGSAEDAQLVVSNKEDLSPLASRSAEALRAMAQNRLLAMRLERAAGGTSSDAYEAHTRAAVAMADALLTGTARLGCVVATKQGPPP